MSFRAIRQSGWDEEPLRNTSVTPNFEKERLARDCEIFRPRLRDQDDRAEGT
jgi:hypothetical protein